MHDNLYAFKFTAGVCIGCAILVSTAATALKPFQDANRKLDEQKNILVVLGLMQPGEGLSASQITEKFESVTPVTLDSPEPAAAGQTGEATAERRLYVLKKGEQIEAYCIPISGRGLWSTLYGYLALEADGNTIKGITFYQHGETPGLGGEIDNPTWKAQFVGKKILEDDKLVSIHVIKGSAAPDDQHAVDGISGATITSRAVDVLLRRSLEEYQSYLAQQAWGKKDAS